MPLPRIDVSNAGLVAALVALLTLVIQAFAFGVPINYEAAWPLAVVVAMGAVAYAVPTINKEVWGVAAGAVLTLVQFVFNARAGNAVDASTLVTTLTWLVNSFFLYVLPRIQPASSAG